MRPYEAMVVLRPNLEEDALEAVKARLTSVITDQGGEITHIDQWGKRRLAYEIDGHIEGFYVVMKFQGDPGITTELERIMRITDSVMRFLVIRDEAPSAVPQTSAAADAEAAEGDAPEAAQADADAAAGDDAPAAADGGAAEADAGSTDDADQSSDASDAESEEDKQ